MPILYLDGEPVFAVRQRQKKEELNTEIEPWYERSFSTTKASTIATWAFIILCIIAAILGFWH